MAARSKQQLKKKKSRYQDDTGNQRQSTNTEYLALLQQFYLFKAVNVWVCSILLWTNYKASYLLLLFTYT